MAVEFTDLPYPIDALEPHVSAQTLQYHYGKHHRGYVDKLNVAIAGTSLDDQPLEQIVREANATTNYAVFNNAAQVWNHAFLWNSMSPDGGGDVDGELAAAIDQRFGSLHEFCHQFRAAALGQFGSGWAWLIRTNSGLEITTTGNAGTPLVDDVTPLLTLDVWEHAYYLDYQNQRDAYVDAFLNNLINWDFAAKNFAT